MEEIEDQIFENLQIESLHDRKEYMRCRFIKCKFISSHIDNCIFRDCEFRNSVMSNVLFNSSKMYNSKLIHSTFLGINWNSLLGKGKGSRPFTSTENCLFKYCAFHAMDLSKHLFAGSQFHESVFTDCNLLKTDFGSVPFEGTQFVRCNLEEADFRQARGYVIDIKTGKLKNAKFSLPEVIDLLRTLQIDIS